MDNNKTIYSIGHSNHSLESFIDLLKQHQINCVIDVRSMPASSHTPQFNKDSFSNYLKTLGITYLHFGEEFGARHTDPAVLDKDGKVDFDKVRTTQKFLSGVERLNAGLQKGFTIALMCSEGEPFDCHRFSLISYYLSRHGFNVEHVLKDGSLINNNVLEERLIKKYHHSIPSQTLFSPAVNQLDQIDFAYKMRGLEIAYQARA